MKAAVLVLASLLPVVAGDLPIAPPGAPGNDVGRISDVVQQLRKNLNDLPPDVVRMAVYQFKADAREFRSGTTRYLQGRVEEAFATEGRRTVVNSPELKTIRVRSTDTSFSVSNSLPTLDELWKLAEKLHVDAFLEGSVTRSPDNDLMLTLRVFRAKTGELAWTGSYVSGPHREEGFFPDLDLSIYAPLRLLPVDWYASATEACADAVFMTDFDLEVAASEPITPDRRVEFTVSTGYTHMTLRGLPDSTGSPPGIHLVHLGAEVAVVLVRKADPAQGYWLSTYAGYDDFLPLAQRQHFGAFRFGYRSHPTRHLSLGGGVMMVPFGNHMVDSPGLGKGRTYDLGWIGYEIDFLHFTF